MNDRLELEEIKENIKKTKLNKRIATVNIFLLLSIFTSSVFTLVTTKNLVTLIPLITSAFLFHRNMSGRTIYSDIVAHKELNNKNVKLDIYTPTSTTKEKTLSVSQKHTQTKIAPKKMDTYETNLNKPKTKTRIK